MNVGLSAVVEGVGGSGGDVWGVEVVGEEDDDEGEGYGEGEEEVEEALEGGE